VVTPVYSTTIAQAAFSNDLSQVVQYREAWFYMKEALRIAGEATGGGVVRACDGVTVSSTDNITDPATDVVQGTPGSQAHTWVEIKIGDCWFLFEVNVASGLTTPQNARLFKSTLAYNNNGTTINKPTAQVANRESSSAATFNILGWTAATAGSWFYWVSGAGHVFFATKRDGDTFYTAFVFLSVYDDSAFAASLCVGSATSTNAVIVGNLNAPIGAFGSKAGGEISTGATHTTACPSWLMTNWTAPAVDAEDNKVPHHPIWFGYNSATAGFQRECGYIDDVRGVPTLCPWDYEATEVNDPGTHKWRSVGVLALPFPNGTAAQIIS
jgi:hypothetical protein